MSGMTTLTVGHPDRIILEGVLMMLRVDAVQLLGAMDLASAAGAVLARVPEEVRTEFYELYSSTTKIP